MVPSPPPPPSPPPTYNGLVAEVRSLRETLRKERQKARRVASRRSRASSGFANLASGYSSGHMMSGHMMSGHMMSGMHGHGQQSSEAAARDSVDQLLLRVAADLAPTAVAPATALAPYPGPNAHSSAAAHAPQITATPAAHSATTTRTPGRGHVVSLDRLELDWSTNPPSRLCANGALYNVLGGTTVCCDGLCGACDDVQQGCAARSGGMKGKKDRNASEELMQQKCCPNHISACRMGARTYTLLQLRWSSASTY